MDVWELIDIIEKYAPLNFAASWDKSGLLVLGEKEDIQKVAISLEPSLSAVNKALDWGANFLLTHHPLALHPEFPNKKNEYFYVLKKVLSSGMFLYSAHTSLDANSKGPVSWFAKELGLQNLRVIDSFLDVDEKGTVGFGLRGEFSARIKTVDFIHKVKSILGIDILRAIGKAPSNIKHVAYCPGSGASLAEKAFKLGVDVFITGDFKYHEALEVGFQGFVLDVGHFILEEMMMQYFYKDIAKNIKEVDFIFIQSKDPFCYL
ncbi:dinuclear metal center protein, YbgI/SA1388 family [Desulfonauticus submarinus]|uniref:GTP cyclohydrolase 1 type 2 homolog n=1 Tax=Desulfonauticus submarinus TaxID=206665 RepID=A0A1G9ZJD8_9BACT|nr:Nif3-like dinuclear metal center hexameric protein [Desulfonauticus submarinus]SDN21420.1 dinuclear metal center protein, YbgI/SA1388 family [Desulfonauticus submarinus]